MLHSQSIASIKSTKIILEFFGILPFEEIKCFQWIYYISLLLVFEVLFSTSIYLLYFNGAEAYSEIFNYESIYFHIAEDITWYFLGRFFSFGVLLTLCNRSAHRELIKRMAVLDIHVKSQLRIDVSFCRMNIEFIIFGIGSFLYNFVYYAVDATEMDLNSVIYYGCCTMSAIYFFVYGVYTVYWARVFTNRAEYIIDALKTATSQKYISKQSLTIVMQLIKLLFDVRECIQDAFGSTLCIILVSNAIFIGVPLFALIDNYERDSGSTGFYANYSMWTLALSSEFIFITVFFSQIGDVVSYSNLHIEMRM